MSTDLRTALADRLDHVAPPPADLDAVVRAGTRRRRTRQGAVAVAVAGAAATVVAAAAGMVGHVVGEVAVDHPSLGRLDFSDRPQSPER